jgi:hypothetical protein
LSLSGVLGLGKRSVSLAFRIIGLDAEIEIGVSCSQ